MKGNTDIFDITYEDLVQFVQEYNINMNEFVLVQEELAEEYESWKQRYGYSGTPEQAMFFLDEYEEHLYINAI